ncbi:MAG: hypothetical protein VX254_00125 [Planctomycetota bacterium]|nr:hypothetical protein [Planctomycetota bacterium]
MQLEKCFTPALTCFLIAILSGSQLASQEDPNEDVQYKPYLELVSSEYVPAPKGGKQTLKLKLDFSADLPLGTKIQMDLVHNGLPLIGETIFFDFKTSKRKGFIYEWMPKKSLGVDSYYLRVQVDLLSQVAKVRKEFATKEKVFPPKANPLVWLYGQEKYAIKVGTEAELQAQQEMMCSVYDDFINELAGNWNDLKKTLDAVREGKKYSNAGVVDQKALEDFIRKWRRKQGGTQKGILRDFPEKWPAVHSKTLTAHANLLRLGRMVAKRSVSYQRDLEKELQLQRINPRLNTKDKEDAVLQFFDYGYRYKVSKDSLNRTMDNIYRLVCPEEEEEEEAEAAPEEGDAGAGSGN